MIIEPKTGTLLAQLGQVAFSTGASTLPQLGRFYAKRLSNKFILQYPYFYRILPTYAIPVVRIPFI